MVEGTYALGPGFLNFPAGADLYFRDFFHFANASEIDRSTTAATQGSWAWGATGTADAPALNDEVYGTMTIATRTTSAADNDYAAFQKLYENIKLGTGLTLRFIARAKMSAATDSEMFLGVGIKTSNQAILGGTNYMTDFIGFGKDDDTTAAKLRWAKNATATSSYTSWGTVLTMDTSYHVYAFKLVTDPTTAGKGKLQCWIDGSPVGYNSGTSKTVEFTTFCDDEVMSLSFGVGAGTTAAASLTLDYIGVALGAS